MVKKKTAAAAGAPGPTCTVVDGCTGKATLQATRSCDSCGGETVNLQGSADKRRRELEEFDRREDAIKTAARARAGRCGCGDETSHDGSTPESNGKPGPCPRPQSGDLTDPESFDLQLIARQRQDAGENLEQLEAAIETVAKQHTHPVFACDKHTARLPK